MYIIDQSNKNRVGVTRVQCPPCALQPWLWTTWRVTTLSLERSFWRMCPKFGKTSRQGFWRAPLKVKEHIRNNDWNIDTESQFGWQTATFLMPCLCCQTVTDDAVELWADRALSDFNRKVGKNAPSKQKAGGPKNVIYQFKLPICTIAISNQFGSPMFIFCLPVRRWLSETKLAWLSYSRTAASWTIYGHSFKGILVKARSSKASCRSGSLGTLAALTQDLGQKSVFLGRHILVVKVMWISRIWGKRLYFLEDWF